jgi:hypothetical protein
MANMIWWWQTAMEAIHGWVFPQGDQPGITTSLLGLTNHDYAWSPDGRQIALIYQGNLWVVNVETTVAYQLTFDGQSQYPVWAR